MPYGWEEARTDSGEIYFIKYSFKKKLFIYLFIYFLARFDGKTNLATLTRSRLGWTLARQERKQQRRLLCSTNNSTLPRVNNSSGSSKRSRKVQLSQRPCGLRPLLAGLSRKPL